ncbi:adenine nucleotide alpha hydrolases-like protein [Xylariaceae sp. FL0255]|nr:adenine nucleotide alpha hydrolases-like protein [Xylariaceae sp. FL0255]
MLQTPPGQSSPSAQHLSSPPNGYPVKSPSTLYHACVELEKKVEDLLASKPDTAVLQNVQSRVREAVSVIEEAFERYTPEQISLSYNGGKDCLVLLVIILACLSRRNAQTRKDTSHSEPPDGFPKKLQAIYIVSEHPFSEIDDFVGSSSAKYNLEIARYESGMKQALEAYLADRPNIKAIFVGTRRTDPHGEKLTHFDRTDSGWPDFMRIHPVIDWHYAEIWAFIRRLGIPYCSLYDQGYTSLGGTQDTLPNPHLKKQDGSGEGFLPAYVLTGDHEERLGREK